MRVARETPVGSDVDSFLIAHGFGCPVGRLGLASYGRTAITPDDLLSAVDRGVSFLNWQGLAEGASDGDPFIAAISSLGAGRQSVVICAQFGARTAEDAARELRSALAALKTDYIDVLTLYVQQPAVAVTLSAPQSRAELNDDLRVFDFSGPLTSEEYAVLVEHGERVRRHSGVFR